MSLPPAADGTAPSSPAGAPSAGGGSGSAAAASSGPRATAAPRPLDLRRLKTRNRVSVRFDFTLPKADHIFVIVRGPAPSCRIAGYIPVRGHKGRNTVAFAGRVHGRRLDPGVYSISLSPSRRLVPGAPTAYVRVVSPRRSLPLPDSARKPSCNDAASPATDSTGRILIAGATPAVSTPTVRPAPAPTRPRVARTVPAEDSAGDDDDEEEAGIFLPDAGVLGVATGEGVVEPYVTFALLSLVAALLVAFAALANRLRHRSGNH